MGKKNDDRDMLRLWGIVKSVEGGDGERMRFFTIEGIGFWTDAVLEADAAMFFLRHEKAFCRSAEEREILGKIRGGSGLSGLFRLYPADYPGVIEEGHWEVGVANVMFREAGIRFIAGGFEDAGCRPCIMFAQSYPWLMNTKERLLSEEALIGILRRYAKDLGVVRLDEVWLRYEDEAEPEAVELV